MFYLNFLIFALGSLVDTENKQRFFFTFFFFVSYQEIRVGPFSNFLSISSFCFYVGVNFLGVKGWQPRMVPAVVLFMFSLAWLRPALMKHLRRIYTWFAQKLRTNPTIHNLHSCESPYFTGCHDQSDNTLPYGPDWRFSFPLAGESPTASLEEVPPDAGVSREISPVPAEDLELPPADWTYMTPVLGPYTEGGCSEPCPYRPAWEGSKGK